ncbi:S-adenosyl-L-methionine-dependent methyltransferase [Cokeromyces recurvatus]|uniref:S-adenosyl-L-methionine-dependent methyltransferase n=1 Tax=Cokeromyces recurvatus TaxID=90255 RepID=UPI0022204CDB|nr:S-adenosyl-L-methionine-dependent methyltransferase [Cokeromyces recurvatus]KAI7906040.1 S-adenosyl-L-methionine-dependent methyltransferase [Cokeromyces recurvatus]
MEDMYEGDMYYIMSGFMTVYISFIQIVLQEDFLKFIQLFSPHDSLSTQGNQLFLPFYDMSLLHKLQHQLKEKNLLDPDFILTSIDSIFSKFYTLYFLETLAQKHQKDHGQFYTPQSVIKFMWDKCATLSTFILHLESQKEATIPHVFDPCLGIGSFLCEFLSRFIKACRFTIWNDPLRLTKLLTSDIPNYVWGIEIDPFAYQLCKLNMIVHLFPLYQRLKELDVQLETGSIHRLKLFCNDTLKLRVDTNPLLKAEDTFERDCLELLRDASKLKFDYIVTNPPYMIRKTGFITQPDSIIYDESILGGKGTQAYLYFMWIALQRCDDQQGQVCLITPSQWTVLEFAQHLRKWIWKHCKLLDMYEFEPYKVWPKVQTDSLVFRICKRTSTLIHSEHTLYLRHCSRKMTLTELLQAYDNFNINQISSNDQNIKYKYTSSVESNDQILTTPHASFAFMIPTASCLEELNQLTHHLPRLCDGEHTHKSNPNLEVASSHQRPPLVWNRGPNTNPVYSLVVRTSWAIHTFGIETWARWLKPCFYWNGKTNTSTNRGGKEGEFWRTRDPLRLSKKETSAAEAYWPLCTLDPEQPTLPFYSLIRVNKEDADLLKEEYKALGERAPSAALYHYLRDARLALQADKTEKEIAHCQYNKCGTEVAVKIVHPINCGYFTRTQPRPRFFVDKTRMAVTNQCIYFTIKPDYPWQDPDYYCGLLNSILIQFFTKAHCCYDQQGRMRFFGRSMAYIPFAPPPSIEFMRQISIFVQGVTVCRTWLYSFVRHTSTTGHQPRLMERIRHSEWQPLSKIEMEVLNQIKIPTDTTHFQPDTSLSSTLNDSTDFEWIRQFVQFHCHYPDKAAFIFITLLKIASLFQFMIDQMVYFVYQIPERLQLEIEQDLKLEKIREEWIRTRRDVLFEPDHMTAWFERVLSIAISFTKSQEELFKDM